MVGRVGLEPTMPKEATDLQSAALPFRSPTHKTSVFPDRQKVELLPLYLQCGW